jgi:DNA-binding CsgD family transcriptional regulator
LQAFQLTGAGHSLQAIGLVLGLSIKTVGTYREQLKVKLGLDNIRMLERYAHDHAPKDAMPF